MTTMTARTLAFILTLLWMQQGCVEKENTQRPLTVTTAMDDVIARLYDHLAPDQLDTIGHRYVLGMLSEREEKTLATRYWTFNVNVPVRVSLMRDVRQPVIPFWLEPAGFTKTALQVKNEHYTYEVWQKEYPAGEVGLGINGFGKHRPVYFIAVESIDADDSLVITDTHPAQQHFEVLEKGAFTYQDWDELVLTEVPKVLEGQVLFTTIRGRAREAHIVGGFRTTPYPSSQDPDQITLTWSDDPHSTVDIQWRVSTAIQDGMAEYWRRATPGDTLRVEAVGTVIDDRLLRNDPKIYHYTARLRDLEAGETYEYRVGDPAHSWSEPASFQVPEHDDSFSFIWFGDTHRSKKWGDLLQMADEAHPRSAFYSIAGDIVSTGLYRDDWDRFFGYAGKVFARKPLMPVPGNHDNQDGLGAWMYQELFSLPENGPESIEPEFTYAFNYKNALFLMIDCTSPVSAQSEWIEQQLQSSSAVWKFAFFHFPPYSWEEDYPDIRREWGRLFDEYHVDMVMSGHVHYYMRSLPICDQKVVQDPEDGTIYVISIGIPSREHEMPMEAYAAVRNTTGWLYQHMEIEGRQLTYQCIDYHGEVVDRFKIEKPY